MIEPTRDELEIFATCPPSSAHPLDYPERVAEVARWSERAGCKGILVYTDHTLLDPWVVAQMILERTETLCPLVAVQPVAMHPFTVAKFIASLGALYGRRVCLNMVSGGFRNDLLALDDRTPHDRRYERLLEYVHIVQGLVAGGGRPLTFRGEFYRVENLRLSPAVSAELRPDVFVSGSSAAGLAVARELGAVAIRYPRPSGEEDAAADWPPRSGIRAGIIARDTDAEAWRVAFDRFPPDRRGQLTHQLAMKVTDSVWHQQLSERARAETAGPYWLVPFENYKTMCPYLVGSYRRVGEELARYRALGVRTLVLDVPPDHDELWHTRRAIDALVGEEVVA